VSEKREIRKRLEAAAMQKAKIRDGHLCMKCRKRLSDCGHHVVYKSQSGRLAYDPDNIIRLCDDCHAEAHSHAFEFITWFEKKYPKRYAFLMTVIKIYGTITLDELGAAREKIKAY